MTVTQHPSKVIYAGDGTQVEFFVPFVFYEADDLEVLKVASDGSETTLTADQDYSVYRGSENGAVTLSVAPTNQERLVVVRNLPLEQPIDYRSNDPFPAETHERGLDRLTLLCQQLDERLSRTFSLSRGSTADSVLPPAEAGAFIGWNSVGSGLENKTVVLPQAAIVAGGGIAISGNDLSVDLAPNSGLEISGGELLVKVDDATIRRGENGALRLVDPAASWITGDVKITTRGDPDAGWLNMDGSTIGGASSGATHSGDPLQDLFVHLWSVMANDWAPVTGGRGATALQDWIDGKALTLSHAAGRAIIGQGAGPGLALREPGETGGEETHALTEAELPRHRHSMTGKRGSSNTDGGSPAFGAYSVYEEKTNKTEHTGGDQPHNNMPPFLALNVMIKI